jgi:hypothetical protein
VLLNVPKLIYGNSQTNSISLDLHRLMGGWRIDGVNFGSLRTIAVQQISATETRSDEWNQTPVPDRRAGAGLDIVSWLAGNTRTLLLLLVVVVGLASWSCEHQRAA